MSIKTELKNANIQRAVIVDDAYESIPLAKDLAQDEESWGQFFEDINDGDRTFTRKIFPNYDNFRGDQLKANDDFVKALWENKEKFQSDIVKTLFTRYSNDHDQDLAYLKTLTDSLEACGLECILAGKSFEQKAINADLIIIDLFLGSAQDEEAVANSVSGLHNVIQKRLANPPLVILMSRSTRLEAKRKEFRDGSGLFESAFRIIRKTELAEEGKLPRLLIRFAEHYKDTTKLAAFLHAWQTGVVRASKRTSNLIRTLDLADHAQISQLLLNDEGESPGSYLVDVFDRVLQFEIEREEAIIDASIDLNSINMDSYPPPYVAGSPDLQALVYRCLFQNNSRLRLVRPSGNPVGFGDVLRRKSSPGQPTKNIPTETNIPFGDLGPDDVLVVMTPSCDLQRQFPKRVLLLKGSLVPLTSANWFHDGVSARTPVFDMAANQRFQIKWDLKHIETISRGELDIFLDDPKGFEILARLREAHALELQQKLLSSLGRVGLIAPMPGTFPVKVDAYVPGIDNILFNLAIPALSANPGVFFGGRKNGKEATTLVLCEDACEALCEAIQNIDFNKVHPDAKEMILRLRTSNELLILQKGVDVTNISDNKFRDINYVIPATEKAPEEKRISGLVRRAGEWIKENIRRGDLKKAGLILVISDYDIGEKAVNVSDGLVLGSA